MRFKRQFITIWRKKHNIINLKLLEAYLNVKDGVVHNTEHNNIVIVIFRLGL